MEIKVKAMNEDGSVAFEGNLNAEQLSFILSVGVNYLLSQGAGVFLEENEQNTGEDTEDDDANPAPRH